MRLDKICEALSQTDQLACGVLVSPTRKAGCALGQLFLAAGKTEEEISREQNLYAFDDMFDGLLVKEYGLDPNSIYEVWTLNDSRSFGMESNSDRHKRVLKHFENELLECLIKESSSSSPVEEDSNLCEDASIAPLPMELIST